MPDHERERDEKSGMKYKRKQADRNKNREGDKEHGGGKKRENRALIVFGRHGQGDEKRWRDGVRAGIQVVFFISVSAESSVALSPLTLSNAS